MADGSMSACRAIVSAKPEIETLNLTLFIASLFTEKICECERTSIFNLLSPDFPRKDEFEEEKCSGFYVTNKLSRQSC